MEVKSRKKRGPRWQATQEVAGRCYGGGSHVEEMLKKVNRAVEVVPWCGRRS